MTLKRHRLIQRRRVLGFSQEKFAEAVGVDRTTVVRWECAETEPQPWSRPVIARALKVSLEDLETLLADIVQVRRDRQIGRPATRGRSSAPDDETMAELRERLATAAAVDGGAIALFSSQVDHIREVDRMLGAHAAGVQLRGYLTMLDSLRSFAVLADQREPLADLYADVAALAGWQCLDLGELPQSWNHHEAAKDAGREGHCPSALAHAMAQQAYVLVELGDTDSALQLAQYARSVAGGAVPRLLISWLWAVEGEIHAAAGNDKECHRAFELAHQLLPGDGDPELPYIVLDEVHLARWRGNAWARLGDIEAIEELQEALGRLDSSFTRAKAGLHVDLAYAFASAHQEGQAIVQLQEAQSLAARIGSARQRRRIRHLWSVLRPA